MNQLALAGALALAAISGYYLTLPDPDAAPPRAARFEDRYVTSDIAPIAINEDRVAATITEVEAASKRLRTQIDQWRKQAKRQ